MTSTPITPMNAKSSGLCVKDGLAGVPTAVTGATAEEVEEVEDDGTTMALAKCGVTGLARTAGRIGGIGLVRIAHRAMRAFLLYHHRQGGMTTMTRGLGASRSRAQSLASWVARRPQPHSASSSSLLAR